MVADAPWERTSIDLTGPHPPAKDSQARHILAVVDHFTKWTEACPLPNKEATTVARALAEQVFTRHGIPVHAREGRVDLPEGLGGEVAIRHAAYRTSRHEATGFSPNLVIGGEVRAPIDFALGTTKDMPASSRENIFERQERLY